MTTIEALERIEDVDNVFSIDLSSAELKAIPLVVLKRFTNLRSLNLSHNLIEDFPAGLDAFKNLQILNLKNNLIHEDNSSGSVPENLVAINLSGNLLHEIPPFVFSLCKLEELHLGANQLQQVPSDICQLPNLRLLYLGGNRLNYLAPEIGSLSELRHLSLSDNRMSTLPQETCQLRQLKCLELHDNLLQTLPVDLLKLDQLLVLSLRNNPLVVNFVRNHEWTVPTLKELSARFFLQRVQPGRWRDRLPPRALPPALINYLESAQCCENPACSGVYFSSHVSEIKFRDFCGKFRLPLLQYLCSPVCTSDRPVAVANDQTQDLSRINRVLFG